MDSLYKKVYDINLLKKAWHLARSDSRTDFIQDPLMYNDFALNLGKNLYDISIALKEERYHPNPLRFIDVPKSTLSVRPGSITSIEDRIVLFAIIYLIAPKLDKKLPDTVYSYRLKKKFDKKSLFKDLEILKYPFLKKKTIQKHIEILEPWYGQWPKFIEESVYAFEEEGYKFLTVSDITAYFENINLRILRDILLKHLPHEQKLLNLLCSILEYWTWPAVHGLSIDRGIPQGNEVSSFLGNIYLLPLDETFTNFAKKKDIKYFRYMDDVKIFSKEESVAREVVFVMNNALRKLHLNIQGSKTVILKEKEIYEDLLDPRLEKVNKIIKNIQANLDYLSSEDRDAYINSLKQQYKKIKHRSKLIHGKDLRLYRRLITGFTLLKSSYMVNSLLKQLTLNPDERLIGKAVVYLKHFPKSCAKIEKSLLAFLNSSINLFPYQEARIIELLRTLKCFSKESISYAKKCLRSKQKHWYVKVQSALLLANLDLQVRTLNFLEKMYKQENNILVKRSLIKGLCQLEKEKLREFIFKLICENEKNLFTVGRMLLCIFYNKENTAIWVIDNIFKDFNEEILMENFYKIDVIKHCNNRSVQERLLKKLKAVRRAIKREHLVRKVNRTILYLSQQIQN